MSTLNLIGQRFGKLMVTGLARPNQHGQRRWLCLCDCGTTSTVRTGELRSGHSRSCGCARATQNALRHGGSRRNAHTPAYSAWQSMKARCANTREPNYGGRGIAVCERWMDFANFLADMGERPEGTTLDRINVNGNYEPGNCRWATPIQQQRNKRSNTIVNLDGKAVTLSEACEHAGLKVTTVIMRTRRGWSLDRALTEPLHVSP